MRSIVSLASTRLGRRASNPSASRRRQRPGRCGGFLLAALVSAATLDAAAAVVVLPTVHAGSVGRFTHDGTVYEGQSGGPGLSGAAAQLLLGDASTPELRAAARISADELAVNVRIDGKTDFRPTEVQNGNSQVSFGAEITSAGGAPEHLYVAFHLPAGYVENQHNGETQFHQTTSAVQARITLQRCGGCAIEELFFYQALLESTFREEVHDVQATGQAGLDVSPLLDSQFSDSGPGFLRRLHLGFEDFSGVLDLGVPAAGEDWFFDYTLFARSEGTVAHSYGIAAINDPFFFDSDPVRRAPSLRFFSVPVDAAVPEPGGAALLAAAGLAGVLTRRRPRR